MRNGQCYLKQNIYKNILKQKQTQQKELYFTHYKQYRNMLTQLIRNSKLNYYKSFFTEHKQNLKKNVARHQIYH